ncbi:MAG: M20/M25/M40 family metallo-hydrolase [Chloroflexota bacterium]
MEVERILSELIKIPSVNPPGGETEVAEFLKKLFDPVGIKNEIIESAPGRGSFIATLGTGKKSLLFLSHTDVVPVGEGWDFDPFSGEIKNGLVLGRGAQDCKDLVAAEAWAMLELSKVKLDGKLIFAATADEEAMGDYGVGFIVKNHPDKLQADFAINEGAGEPIRAGKRLIYFIQAGEKGPAWTRLRFSGVSCHGAIPTLGDNAVTKASKAIARLAEYKPEVKIIPEMKALINNLGQQHGRKEITEKNIDTFLSTYPDRTFAERLRALTRMTISPNMILGGNKTNIVPDSCKVEVDIRVLPGQDKEYVINQLRSIIGEDVQIELPVFDKASFSSTDTPYLRLIQQTMKDVLGDVDCLPTISAGATDSRFLRAQGIPSYGPAVDAPDFDPAMLATYHAKNERVDIKSLKMKADFLTRLASKYLGAH